MLNVSAIPDRSLLGRLLRAPLRLLPRRLDMPVWSGPTRGMRWRVGSSNHGCWLGTFEADKVHVLERATRSGMTALDIGANAGFYTLAFSRWVGSSGRVFAFEPFAENVVNLAHHIDVNQLQNCTLIQCALSTGSGVASFLPGPSNSMGALGKGEAGLKVPTASIDELIATGTIGLPDIVKMDVEGGEGDVLAGAKETLRSSNATWFIALHGTEAKRTCERLLRAEGYRLFAMSDEELTAPLEALPVDEIYAKKTGAQSLKR